MSPPFCLLSIHAHPDDESSKGAGTVARYHTEGVHTVLVCCTGGEEGDILNPAMDREDVRADIGAVRKAELDRAAAIIGYDEVVMLGYRDSGMPESEANANPEAFANADLDEAVGRLVAIIRRTRPQVILTYGDEQEGYPHPDHLRVHDITHPAVDRAADPAWYPEAGEPWQVAKIYYSVWSKKRAEATHEKYLELGLESPFSPEWFDRPWQDERITTSIDIAGLQGRRHGRPAGPRHPGRPRVAVLVRAAPRGVGGDPPVRRLHPGQLRGRGSHPRGRPLRRSPGAGVVQHLSQAWVDLHRSAAEGLPERPGATARLQHVVTGTPGGEVAYAIVHRGRQGDRRDDRSGRRRRRLHVPGDATPTPCSSPRATSTCTPGSCRAA